MKDDLSLSSSLKHLIKYSGILLTAYLLIAITLSLILKVCHLTDESLIPLALSWSLVIIRSYYVSNNSRFLFDYSLVSIFFVILNFIV